MSSAAYFRTESASVHGEKVSLPIVYEDGSAAYFFFLVPAKQVSPLLKGGFHPANLGFGRTLVAICFYEYRLTSIGPYNELGLGVLVESGSPGRWAGPDLLRRASSRSSGFYVLHLPVTSEPANRAGREIWGLPKFVTEIPFHLEGGKFLAGVVDPGARGRTLFEIECDLAPGISTKGLDLALFNDRPEGWEKSVVTVGARFRTSRCRNYRLTVGDGTHPLGETLRRLGLEGLRPTLVQYTTEFASKLYPPVKIPRAG